MENQNKVKVSQKYMTEDRKETMNNTCRNNLRKKEIMKTRKFGFSAIYHWKCYDFSQYMAHVHLLVQNCEIKSDFMLGNHNCDFDHNWDFRCFYKGPYLWVFLGL